MRSKSRNTSTGAVFEAFMPETPRLMDFYAFNNYPIRLHRSSATTLHDDASGGGDVLL